MDNFLRELRRLHACREAVEWAATQPDPETLWRTCELVAWCLGKAEEARRA